MKNIRILLVLVLSLWGATAWAQAAPDFSLQDANGKTVTLSEYRGQVVVLHFWATWCPYCKKVQPGLDALYKKHQDQGLVLLGVSFNEEGDAKPQQTLDARGHSFKTLVKGEQVAAKYQVMGTPTTFFIDRKGELRAVTQTSNPNEPKLAEVVEVLLKEK